MNRRLNIAVVIRNFVQSGGAERYAVEVTRRLSRKHMVTIYCQTCDPRLTEGLEVVQVPRYFIKPRWLNHFLFNIWARKLWRTQGHDRVWSHERHWEYNACVIHCPCYKTKFLEKGSLWLYYLKCLISLRHFTYVWMEALQFKAAPGRVLISVSDYITRNIRLCYPNSDLEILMAPPGVNPAHLLASAPKDGQTLEVLFVGTEFERKGLEHAIEGFAKADLKSKRLRIAGGGHQAPFLKIARSLGVEDQVDFLGLTSDIESLYASSHIFLFPTLNEPFGMAPLEAMAHGLPVILSSGKYNGFAETLNPDEAIFLENPKNHDSIRKALEHLASQRTWKTYHHSSLRVSQRMDWEQTSRQHEKALTHLLAPKPVD
jgi:glycosyltransferase involved in cell wall biosynthesis